MNTKVNQANWGQLEFLINNFYEIVEYKHGRGIYGDRVVLKRPRNPEAIVGTPDRLQEFYYMDANAVKELPLTLKLKIQNIVRLVTSVEAMNVLTGFDKNFDIANWAGDTKQAFENANTLNFDDLNDILVGRYEILIENCPKFAELLKNHQDKQHLIAESLNLIESKQTELRI